MNSLKNRVQLIGNVGQDPAIKVLDNGNKMARLSLATNESWKNKDGDKITETQWHQLVAWGGTADLLEKYVTKGKEIGISGKLVHRDYDDAQGQKRYITEVVISEVMLLRDKV